MKTITNLHDYQSLVPKPNHRFDYLDLSSTQLFELARFAIEARHLTDSQRLRLLFNTRFACERNA